MGIRNLFGLRRGSSRHRDGALRRRFLRSSARIEALEQRAMLVGEVVINEIHYNPDVETELVEFIELYNTSAAPINLSNWSFSQGVEYVFPVGATIAANNYYVIAQNAAQFQTKFGFAPNGVFVGGLNGDGENVRLKNAADVIEDEVDYQLGFPWPTVGDAVGRAGQRPLDSAHQPGAAKRRGRKLALGIADAARAEQRVRRQCAAADAARGPYLFDRRRRVRASRRHRHDQRRR